MLSNPLERAGLPPIRFHDLRHTAATLLTKQGAQPHVTQEILEHSDMRITQMVYIHVLDESKQEAVDALATLFEPDTEEQ